MLVKGLTDNAINMAANLGTGLLGFGLCNVELTQVCSSCSINQGAHDDNCSLLVISVVFVADWWSILPLKRPTSHEET